MDTFLQDLRYVVRTLLKNPGFAAVAVLALALGIGANTAIFSVVNAVLLRPLPFPDPDRLAMIYSVNPAKGFPRFPSSAPDFLDWRAQTRSYEEMAAVDGAPFNLIEGTEPERLDGSRVSASFFKVIGIRPALGRDFVPQDDRDGADPVVLIGDGLWRRRFGADPGLVGRAITLDGRRRTVIGVMPLDCSFPNHSEVWAPIAFTHDDLSARGAHYLHVFARLKGGVTLEAAQAEIDTIASRLRQQYPDTNAGWDARVSPLADMIVGKIRPALLVLVGAVAFVLLIACANVANLLLARATERRKEVAIRLALGAGRRRLVRQFLTESAILGLTGGLGGLVLALWGTDLLVAAGGDNLPRFREISVDGRVLLFTLGLSLLTGLVFGVVPALQASRPDLNETLKEGGRGGTAGPGRHRFRSALAIGEIALALVLLVGAGLMLRSFRQLLAVDAGFRPDHLLTLEVALPETKYPDAARQTAFLDETLLRLAALPGVDSAAAATTVPLSGGIISYSFRIDGGPDTPPSQRSSVRYDAVSAGFFRAMGIPLLQGRGLLESDVAGSPRVAVISAGMARKYLPGENPIGRRIQIDNDASSAPREIVGVVGDVKHSSLDGEAAPHVYEPLPQAPSDWLTFVLRASVEPEGLQTAARRAILAIDPQQPVSDMKTGEALIADSVAQPHLAMMLLGVFAAAALLLAALGTYGVVAFSVSQRTHEFGVRMALGAGQREVLTLVVRQGLVLGTGGVVLGLLPAAAATRLLTGLLFGVSAGDPLVYLTVGSLLIAVALLASVVPARRASAVDPIIALRAE